MPNSIYLLEHIGEDNNWEWWDAYDTNKHTLLEIFNAYLADMLGEDIQVRSEHELKKEGDNCWYYKEHDVRVWEINI